MKNENQIFFEEYKRLDKLLKEVLSSDIGVTAYIDEMKAVSSYEKSELRGFDHTLKRLIEARHMRNQLAHDSIGFDSPLCDEADIKFIKEFRESVFNATDPLSQLYSIRKRKAKTVSTPLRKTTNSSNSYDNSKSGCLKGIGAFIIFIVLFVLAVLASNAIK